MLGLLWKAPASAQQPLFTFAQISDSQPTDESEWQGFEDVLTVIARAGQGGALLPYKVDLVLFPGDIVSHGSSTSEFTRARGLLDTWITANNIPLLCAPGNHDQVYKSNGTSDTTNYANYIASPAVWEAGSAAFTGQNGRSRTTGWAGLRFIGFNNSWGAYNVIQSSDIQLINSRVVAANAAGENVFLVGHHPHNGQDQIPLADTLKVRAVNAFLHGHSGSPSAKQGLTGVDNPNAWNCNTNAIIYDRDLIYYEVFQTELRAFVVVLNSSETTLPSPKTIKLVFPLTTSVSADRGFEDGSHSTARAWPSGPAPEKKLWFQGGSWWGVLWSQSAAAFRLQRLDTGSQTWIDSGTSVSTSTSRSFDALADGSSKLYLSSHVYSTPSAPGSGSGGQVLRYTYNSSSRTYALDSGFPVTINDARTEALALAKDTLGTLWATWCENGEVHVNHTVGGVDTQWSGSALVPFASALGLDGGDVSALAAFDGKIGLAWTDRIAGQVHFAVREDSAPGSSWQLETAENQAGAVSDALDLATSGAQVLIGTETPTGALRLLARSVAAAGLGTWTVKDIADAATGLADPIVVVDQGNALVRVFAMGATLSGGSAAGGGAIYEKDAPLGTLAFPTGKGTPVIQDGSDPGNGAATSTRQTLSSLTGIAVVASNEATQRTWHTYSAITGGPVPPVADFSGSPRSGSAPLLVHYSDLSTGSPTAWLWNFGDGSTSTSASPDHSYAVAGSYDVSLRVSSGAGSDTLSRSAYVTVGQSSSSVTLTTIADVTVNEANPGTNYGTLVTVRVKSAAGSSFRSFLKFDLSSVAGGISAAKLRLFVTDPSDNGGSVYKTTTTSWTESGLTWANQPALPSSAVASVGSVPTTGVWKEIDVTSAVSGTGLLGLELAGGSSNSAIYWSREGTNPPQLLLTVGGGGAPVADFSGTPLTGSAPLGVQFTDLSSGAPTSWLWNFGDGATATVRNPSHSYASNGVFDVTLTATSSLGSNARTRAGYISVGASGGTRTFAPVADARVYESNPGSNYGLDSALRLKTDPGSTYRTFLKFDLGTLSGAPTSARLRVFVTDESNSGGSAYLVSNSWSETAITWSNQPALPASSLATAGAAALGTWIEFDVSSAVVGPGIVSFALAGGTTNSVLYSSREGANPPQLVVQTGSP